MKLIDVLGQIGTVAAAVFAGWALWQNSRNNRKQSNIQAFLAYTERFERVMASMPAEACQARFDLEKTLPPASDDLTECVMRYLNLTSEEFYLWQRGYLDKRVWQIWEKEIQRMLCSPLFRREWPKLVTEFTSFEEFIDYVRKVQRGDKIAA